MSSRDPEDSLTTLNTALNKSMVLMDSPIEHKDTVKGAKLIKINTKAQLLNQPSDSGPRTPELTRKSILKKSKTPEIAKNVNTETIIEDDVHLMTKPLVHNRLPRPHTLEDFLTEDTPLIDPSLSTFNLEDLSDSEEMWVMDIPKTVNPRKLKGQTLLLGDKSKLKVDEERYCAVSRNSGCCLTWVFSTGSERKLYKAVNIKPAGTITVRRKLPGTSKQATDSLDSTFVPFPSNLKLRHPFFGPGEVKE